MNFIKQNIEKMEDFSQSSTASTIPPEIISNDDDDILDEIDRVNDFFFFFEMSNFIPPTVTETLKHMKIILTKATMMNKLPKIMTIQILAVNFPLK